MLGLQVWSFRVSGVRAHVRVYGWGLGPDDDKGVSENSGYLILRPL